MQAIKSLGTLSPRMLDKILGFHNSNMAIRNDIPTERITFLILFSHASKKITLHDKCFCYGKNQSSYNKLSLERR